MVALKLCGGRGVYEGRKLAKFHDPRPRHRLPSTAVSAKKRSMYTSLRIAAGVELARAGGWIAALATLQQRPAHVRPPVRLAQSLSRRRRRP